jgi:hypothetical protein
MRDNFGVLAFHELFRKHGNQPGPVDGFLSWNRSVAQIDKKQLQFGAFRLVFKPGLSDGVMVAHSPLEAIVMVRVHVGQPNYRQ